MNRAATTTDTNIEPRHIYAELVRAYVDGPDEQILLQVANLGRELVRTHTPTELLGELHHHAVAQLARSHPDLTLGQANELVTEPLMELLIAYGLDFRERLDSTEQALQAKVAELARANLAKRQFLANMSHEIRTPLNGVLGMTWLLRESPLDEEQSEFVRIIQESGEALLSTIDDVLDYSKIEANQLLPEREPFILRDCLESALAVVAVRAHAKDITLGYTLDQEVPAAIIGDVTRLRQVLLNLLSNAVKFSDGGEITIAVRPSNDALLLVPGGQSVQLQFEVTDSGVGIAEERIDAIFDAFRQADESTTRKYGGTGLGLAICKRLVELMGGNIGVRSRLGHGATFYFTIQTCAAELLLPEHVQAPDTRLRGRSLLLLSEQPIYWSMLSQWADRWRMPVFWATSGDGALALMQEHGPFHAALVDARVPGIERFFGETDSFKRVATPIIELRSVGKRAPRAYADQVRKVLPTPLTIGSLYQALRSLLPPVAEAVPAKIEDRDTKENAIVPLRILIAEDNPINRKLAVAMIRRMGYAADTAEDGQQVLQALRRSYYDIVFMDIQMPVLDGVEATRRIRADIPASRQPLIVALTANVASEDRQRFLEAGMDGFLGKPLQPADLRSILEFAGNRSDKLGAGCSVLSARRWVAAKRAAGRKLAACSS